SHIFSKVYFPRIIVPVATLISASIRFVIQFLLLIFFIIFSILLSFLMFKSNVASDDNPLIYYYSQRTGWFDSELEAGKFVILNQKDIPISSDFDYSTNLNYLKTILIASGKIEYIERVTPKTFDEVKNFENIFIFRKEMFEDRLFYLGGRWSQTPHLPLKDDVRTESLELAISNSIIYNSNSIIMFLSGEKI
ncbi:MAG: hypothetical protein NZ942_03690, partial [Candidatus Aenigmarchaeota archaeon]|nr:hypothetical protein [Candidatus Aenigmarchaeota archaeon]